MKSTFVYVKYTSDLSEIVSDHLLKTFRRTQLRDSSPGYSKIFKWLSSQTANQFSTFFKFMKQKAVHSFYPQV